jgi:PAS domain S-box-containing protein
MSYVSPSYTQMLGFNKKEYMTHSRTHLTDNHINDEIKAKTQKAIMGIKQAPYLAETFHKDGSKRLLEVSETPVFDTNGNVIAVEGIAHDVTKQKQIEDEIKQQLKQKEVILKEIHHSIKNNFASIGNLLSMQAQEAKNPVAVATLQDAIGLIKSMEILYEKLLMTDNYNITSFKQYVNNLIDDIITIVFNNSDISIIKQIDDFQLDPKRLIPVGIIVNELLTNIMKYAFPGKDSRSIEIIVKEISGKVTLTISDNGIGLPNGFDLNNQTGFGLILVKMLSEQLEGKFNITSDKGTTCTLEFSIN